MKKTNPKILVFGTGGHAKSVIRIIEAEGKWDIFGLLADPGLQKEDIDILGYKIVGYRNDISHLQEAKIMSCFVAIGDNQLRAKITEDLISKGFKIATIAHPAANVMNNSPIGHGTMIHAQAVIGADSKIGKGTIISALTCIGHDSNIGDYCHITPGVLLGGNVTIGDFSFLGLGSAVLPGVKIGKNVQVAANSVVNKDQEDNVIVAGNPARVIKRTWSK
ncbi:acetyltransferase [Algibacter sp.]|uniref:acetyltransferase n=1 Tax=Algibacter sp. TaxID=1872428 RepID=UPI003C70DD1D